MRNILDRLISTGEFEAVIFGDKVILDETIDKWPHCDFLISFFSKGFPLEKAIDYVRLRQPFCVNDLPMQQVVWDRRLVLGLLDAVGVPTPPRLQTTNGSDFPQLSPEVLTKLSSFGFEIPSKPSNLTQQDYDTIEIDGKALSKPFVEKPVSGEDHNVYIYHASKDGGGVRKLFRKVGCFHALSLV
jgi:inositol hexakisphosphate/diphosphoinositol-pentakisphosphate kinase